MRRRVKLSISGRGGDNDAPTVEDALDQLRDYLDLLRSVEEAVANGGQSQLVWRIVAASKNSPLAVEIEAFPRQHAMNVDRRANAVVTETARGLASLERSGERPAFFTNKAMARAEKIFQRVTNGLTLSAAEFGDDLPTVNITPTLARIAVRHASAILRPSDRPYKEIGSIEGQFQGVELDGHNKRIAHVKERVTGEIIKCHVALSAMQEVGDRQINEIWRNRRVMVHGRISFRGRGRISQMEDAEFRFFRDRIDIPQIDSILDKDFTEGLASEEYLERLRNGHLS